jgi:hypothetical protein
LWNDIIPPSQSTFYRAQKELMDPIKIKYLGNWGKCRQDMLPNSIIVFDGSRSHRRGAKEAIRDASWNVTEYDHFHHIMKAFDREWKPKSCKDCR